MNGHGCFVPTWIAQPAGSSRRISVVDGQALILAEIDDDVLGPAFGALFLAVILLGVWIEVQDRRDRRRATAAKVGPPLPSSNVSRPRLRNGRFAPKNSEQSSLDSGELRQPWQVVASDLVSRASPDVERFVLASPVPMFIEVRCPIDLARVERVARLKVDHARIGSQRNRIGWSMAGGAAIMLTCIGPSRKVDGLVLAVPGIIGAITLWIHVVTDRKFNQLMEAEFASLSSSERYWVDSVRDYLQGRAH